MSVESIDVPTLLRAHIHLQGVLLTEDELSKLWVSYLAYEGTGPWQVREHARITRVGAREYRVVRGSSIPDVYRSPERGRAAAVETALNELESQEETKQDISHAPQVTRMRKNDFSALVVDDNVALREAIARSLARDGWDVTTATDGLEALEAVRTHLFDVVITDVHMPRRGGLWFWEQALALRPELRGKFVFMSSEPLPEPPSGAVFMVKPLSLATLKSELQGIVRRAQRAKVPARESAIVQHTA